MKLLIVSLTLLSPCLAVVLFLPSQNLPTLNDVVVPPPPPQPRFFLPPQLQRRPQQLLQRHPNPHYIPEVYRTAMLESKLPRELRNPFYADPVLASRLAEASRLTPEEMPLTMEQWESNKVPRHKIISLLKDAGLAK